MQEFDKIVTLSDVNGMGAYKYLEELFCDAMEPYRKDFDIACVDKTDLNCGSSTQDFNTLTVTALHKQLGQRCKLQIQAFIHPTNVAGSSICLVVTDDADYPSELHWNTPDLGKTVELAMERLKAAIDANEGYLSALQSIG